MHKNINSGNFPANVLICLCLQIGIEFRHPAAECYAVMVRGKRLGKQIAHFITTLSE